MARIGVPLMDLSRLNEALAMHTHRDMLSRRFRMLTVSQLNFVPLTSSGGTLDIVATINATLEGIGIAAGKINITGTTVFISGNTIAQEINNGITTIDGGKLTANTVAADRMTVSELSAITANLGTVTAGAISGVTLVVGSGNNIFKVASDGDSWWGHATQSSAPAQISKGGAAIFTNITVTGGIIRTAASGKRIEMSSNQIRIYNSSNALVGTIEGVTGTYTTAINMTFLRTTALILDEGGVSPFAISTDGMVTVDTGNICVSARVSGGGGGNVCLIPEAGREIMVYEQLKPNTDNTYDLGDPNRAWQNFFYYNAIQSSDERLKKNIQTIHYGLNEINKLNLISFNWKDNKIKTRQTGLLAQEVSKIIPELTSRAKHKKGVGRWGMNYIGLIPILVKSLQELSVKYDDLEKRIS